MDKDMKKEFGKWLMDISKYSLTAVFLSTIFTNLQNKWLTLAISLGVSGSMLLIGLVLIKKDKRR